MAAILEKLVTGVNLTGSISSRILAVGNGLHVELDENGVISLCLWGITCEEDEYIFEAKLTPEQAILIRNAEQVDAWKVDPGVPCPQCLVQ